MVRAPRFDKNGVKRGAWSEDEDNKLRAYIHRYGHSNWRELPKLAGLSRCGKSCRLRWMNYLRPDIKHGSFTKEEEDIILAIRNKHGNKWSMMAARLPGRSDNEIKNHWHAHLKTRSQRDLNTLVKNIDQEIGNLEPAANTKLGCLVKKPNFKTQQEVEILLAVLSSESRSSCSTSESSRCSLSISDYAVSSDIIEPAVTNVLNEPFLPDNNDGVVSSSYNMFSPLSLDDDGLICQSSSFPDYIMDDVLLWSNLDLL